MMMMMMMNTMQANKCENSRASASVQLQATTRTMHNASLFQQKVILTAKHEKFREKLPVFRRTDEKIRNAGIVILLRKCNH